MFINNNNTIDVSIEYKTNSMKLRTGLTGGFCLPDQSGQTCNFARSIGFTIRPWPDGVILKK